MVRKNAEIYRGKQVKMGGNLFHFRGQTCNRATPPKIVITQGLSIYYLAIRVLAQNVGMTFMLLAIHSLSFQLFEEKHYSILS